MKLYSRGQLIFFCLMSALIVVLFALGIGLLRLPGTKAAASETAVVPEQMSPAAARRGSSASGVESFFDEVYASNQGLQLLQRNVQDLTAYTEDERQNITIYQQLNAGVVNITTETVGINWFLEPVPQAGSSGSGSIINTRGYVLTNNHVIENANKVFINLADGSEFEGTVVGTDPENDLAVLKFDPPQGMALQVIPFGSSDNLKVGQKVLAIGNPFAFERTLTVGIVSGLGRPIQISTNYIIKDMIQTDASINPDRKSVV